MKNKIEIYKEWSNIRNIDIYVIKINGSYSTHFETKEAAYDFANKIANTKEVKPELIFTLEY